MSIGILQGSILGSLPLLLIFINDLVRCSPTLDCTLLADDTNIFSTDSLKLKTELAAIQKWCLSLNSLQTVKTLFVSFKNPNKIYLLPKNLFAIENYYVTASDKNPFLGLSLIKIIYPLLILKVCAKN